MRILVTGAGGQLGSEVVADLSRRGEGIHHGPPLDVITASHGELDVSDRDAVLAMITTTEPDLIIHAAAFTAVDRCESEIDLAYGVNGLGTRHIQEAARLVDAHVTYISTDYVFDGTAARPYVEWDEPRPTSVYGRSKLAGERELDHGATIIRTSWVCGRHGQNMAKTVLQVAGRSKDPLRFVNDQLGSPTIASDLSKTVVELSVARRSGVFHVTNQGTATWYDFARAVLEFSGDDPDRVQPISTAELDPPRPAPRPANSVLDNAALRLSGFPLLPDWRQSLRDLVGELLAT